jgi:isopenicillin N synthase-like dioxygenase
MEVPVIDLEPYLKLTGRSGCGSVSERDPIEPACNPNGELEYSPELKSLCEEVAESLKQTGALVVRDPRCPAEVNDMFLDMMETYFQKPDDFKRKQERPHLHYQVGVTPEGVELPRAAVDKEMRMKIQEVPEEYRPHIPVGADPKWRYMWRVGPRPLKTRFRELNSDPVVPEGFPEWADTMDGWGSTMISTVEVVAEMAGIGFGLPKDSFTSLMLQGPHLLAPTGSDLSRHGKEGIVFAGYHYDLNFLTIHGRSRFPGLYIWLRNGQKVEVRVPVGCLLIQAGKQLEWLTGGDCLAGMHEVVVSKRTLAAIEAARQCGKSLWRVSSTVFGHIASDAILQPLGHFANSPLAQNYPPICAGDFVELELAAINLKGKQDGVLDLENGNCEQQTVG